MNKQNNQPLISVVMCTYNTEKYIAEAIESVLSQTFRDFEFIIWDDGSTDGTKEIVDSFHDDRIRYFYHENTGLGMALRLACAEANGKYIARMDSDDICLPNRFETELNFLEKNKQYVLVSSAVYNINDNGEVLGRVFPCSDDGVLKGILRVPGCMICHPMVMMRREAYEKAGGYIPVRKSQDSLFWCHLAKQGLFYNISEPLGKYRILSSSLDHAENPYREVIIAFLLKMMKDDKVQAEDVEMFNTLYFYSKPFIKKSTEGKIIHTITSEERLYNILKTVMGEKLATKLIVGLKNKYYRHKLKL